MTNSFINELTGACTDGNPINARPKTTRARDNFVTALRQQINALRDIFEYGFDQGMALAKEGTTKRFVPWFRETGNGAYEMKFAYATYSFDIRTGDAKDSYTVLGDGSIAHLLDWCARILVAAENGDLDAVIEKAAAGQGEVIRLARANAKAAREAQKTDGSTLRLAA